MPFFLSDDGTLDTVFECAECGHVERFTYDADMDDERSEGPRAYYIWRDAVLDELNDDGCQECERVSE